jgi:hypothetical protein
MLVCKSCATQRRLDESRSKPGAPAWNYFVYGSWTGCCPPCPPSPLEGVQKHRLQSNPVEAAFARAWKQGTREVLKYILAPPEFDKPQGSVDPSERDEVVAATVIQWLGSPIGQAFLRDLGFEKKF